MPLQTETVPIRVSSVADPLPPSAYGQLQELLPGYVQSQRWFRSKARTIAGATVLDMVPLKVSGSAALIVEIRYSEGDPDIYLLPVTVSGRDDIPAPEIIARLDTVSGDSGVLHNALIDEEFRASLLDSIGCDEEFTGQNGSLVTVRTNAFDRQCGQWVPEVESKVSRAEQSNTSIIYGDRYILKMFRKLEAGLNPDIEIGRFLTEQGFEYTPAVLGGIEYRPLHGAVMNAGLLQAFVPNQGDAWSYTLRTLSEFFARVLKRNAPTLASYHPFDLLDEPSEVIGEYANSARLLGKRTAQMHAALAGNDSNPEFAPEAFTGDYAATLRHEMAHEADRAFGLLREKMSSPGYDQLRSKEKAVRARLESIAEQPISAMRIRHHGDYHLGQVLYTGSDFVIIDFEGEPARDLTSRRVKTLAMRDVAGMARSFSYAAYAALFGQVEGVPSEAASRQQISAWAAYWSALVSAQFLRAYFDTAQGAKFAGQTTNEQRMLFDAFVLQKALYEIAYELNNRPDWVQIPLHGILTLID